MSTDSSLQPLSIKSIATKYTLPVVIRPALGFRGSNQSILLHSIASITFAFGRALRKQRHVKKTEYQSFRATDSERVAIPLKYPGYFECLLPSSHGSEDGIAPETSIASIVEQIQSDLRPRAFYVASPLHVYLLETNFNGEQNRLWQTIDENQIITFEQVIEIEYTPTDKDYLTDADYEYWLFCFSRRIINRREYVVRCLLANKTICYIPCASTDEVCLYPVGQSGSTNPLKLQSIENLVNNFSLPINIKLARFPGAEAYRDFDGYIQLVGKQTDDFAVCASLSSRNVSMIPIKTSMKFLVVSASSRSKEIASQLVRCQMFVQSFDKQIRRILISSQTDTPHRSHRKRQSALDDKRSLLTDRPRLKSDDSIIRMTKDGRSDSSTEKRRTGHKRERAISANIDSVIPREPFRRTLSNESNNTYDSLIHPVQSASLLKQVSTPTPPPSLSKKRSDPSRSSVPFTYDTGINLANDICLSSADGAILLESAELFSSTKPNNRP